MKMVRVGVVRGGTEESGYQKSMSDGSILLRALREHDLYESHDILIDKNEIWHMDGVPTSPERLAFHLDLCISTVQYPLQHHGYVESILRSLAIRCIHSPKEALRGYIPDSLARQIESVGVKLARRLKLGESDNIVRDVHTTFSPPYSVVFVDQAGELADLYYAKHMNDLIEFLNSEESRGEGTYILEEYIPGDEWAVTVLPEFRDTLWYTLHPIFVGSVNPAFRNNVPASRSAVGEFAAPPVRQALDLYSKLTASVMNLKTPATFTFRHIEGRKPTLLRITERHLLDSNEQLLRALKENAISESEFAHMLIEKNWN